MVFHIARHLTTAGRGGMLYAQHVRLFVIMLVAQLLVEINFMIVYIYYRKSALGGVDTALRAVRFA